MKYAPVVAIVYRRPQYARRMLTTLAKNFLAKETEVFVFANAPTADADDIECRDVAMVRKMLCEFSERFHSFQIVERQTHLTANEAICCSVDAILAQYGKAIVLEEDIITAPNFLDFMNQALDYYEKDERIFDVLAMNPLMKSVTVDSFFSYSFMPWGWGTWRNRWQSVDWERTRESLAQIDLPTVREYSPTFDACIRHEVCYGKSSIYPGYWDYSYVASKYRQNKFTVIATRSKALNIGDEGEGENFVVGDLPHDFLNSGSERNFRFVDVWASDIYTKTEIRRQSQMYGYMRNREPWEINNSAMHEVFYQWLMMRFDCPEAISDYLLEQNIKKIAIYGMGRGGNVLYQDLCKGGKVEVSYGIDKRKISDFASLMMFSIEDDLPTVDAVIVTSAGYFYEICAELESKITYPIISLIDVIDKAYRRYRKRDFENLSIIF